MLTVKQINEVSFGKAGFSGYKPEDVDNFIDEVVSSFEQLENERNDALNRAKELAAQNGELIAKNAELSGKLGVLAQKIEAYREDEDGIKEALISAQRAGKRSIEEAKNKAELILQDAKAEAASILDEAKTEASRTAKEYQEKAEEKKAELEEIKQQVSAFRASLMEMYKKHLECIDHIPAFKPAKVRQEEPVEEPEPEPEAPAEEPVQQEEPVQAAAPAPAPAPETVAEPEPQPQPAPVIRPDPAVVDAAPDRTPVAEQPRHSIQVETAPESREERNRRAHQRHDLHERVDFTKEESSFDDLSDVGIDLKTYSSIPESLRQEKDSHYSNLEFGEDVDLGRKKHRR